MARYYVFITPTDRFLGVPTGCLNHAEQPAAGLLRENREESGLEVEIIGVHKVDVDRSRMEVIMVGRFLGGKFLPCEEVDNWGIPRKGTNNQSGDEFYPPFLCLRFWALILIASNALPSLNLNLWPV